MSTRFCRSCGTEFGPEDVFCGGCGTSRPNSEGQGTTPNNPPVAEQPFVDPLLPQSGSGGSQQSGNQPVGLNVASATKSPDSIIGFLGLATAAGVAGYWATWFLSVFVNWYDFKFALVATISRLVAAIAAVGLSGLVGINALRVVQGKSPENRVQFVAVSAATLFAVNTATAVTLFGFGDNNFPGGFLGIPGRISALLVWAGAGCLVAFVVTRKLWTMVSSLRPKGSFIAIAVVIFLVTLGAQFSEWDGTPVVWILSTLSILPVLALMALPGDFGPTAAVILGVASVVSAIGRLVSNILFSVVISSYFANISGAVVHAVKMAVIVGLLFLYLTQRGGLKQNLDRIKALSRS